MAKTRKSGRKPIEQYDHKGKQRVNNPPVGLVTPETDKDSGKKTYAYDPHLDPQLQWAGKAEHTSFEVPTVSLHVHERIDPRTIIEAVRKTNGRAAQLSLFASPEENPPIRQAIEFYKHKHNWTNRLIAGDSLLVMNSLLEKEGMAGKVQMIYIDPPYGIKYGSNFQPFVNKRHLKDGNDEDLTQEPEMIKAFRDTWELGIHSYLTYLRDRLLLARELLTESASVFVQISDENVHHVQELMDEVFGVRNFVRLITFAKTGSMVSSDLGRTSDYLIWYAKDKQHLKYRQLYAEKMADAFYSNVELSDGTIRKIMRTELLHTSLLPSGARVFRLVSLESSGPPKEDTPLEFEGEVFRPNKNSHWKLTYPQAMEALKKTGRILKDGKKLRWKYYIHDYPLKVLSEVWNDTAGFNPDQSYVVETRTKVIERCILMSTDPGDLVFDPTCGSGTTAYVAEHRGRRWVSCDTSRVALTLGRQRLMTAGYDYYELAHPQEGVGSGFKYKTVPHITLKSMANNPDIREGMTRAQIEAAIARHAPQETLYDQPFVDRKKTRVSGPFTVEAVPAPAVKSMQELLEGAAQPADASIARSGETLRQAEWRDELLRTGIRGKRAQFILFSRVEPLPGTRWLHADAQTKPNDRGADSVREEPETYGQPVRAVISFGPEHAPLEQRQVALAIEEAQKLVPKPKIIIFAAFQFDPEAAKDIDETDWPGVTLLKTQMNADLLTEDLKKKRASNESFWLIGQPDVSLHRIKQGKDKGKYRVEVLGFDYYNTKTGTIESGGSHNIAMWMLDTDYDGRSIFPRQVFFPMAGDKEGWSRLARTLKAEIDQELIEAYRGTVSLPFEIGDNRRIAVKIVDDRGIESLRIVEVE